MKKTFNPGFLLLVILILLAGAMRIPNAAQITPWANFSPLGAMALFGGAYFRPWWKAILFPVTILLLGDLVISLWVFNGQYGVLYSGWYWIYGIFVLIVLIGKWMLRNISVKTVLTASLVAALTHWLLADFTVWAGGGTDLRTMQPLSRGIDGLIQCYVQGFPFMRNFLAGTIVYSIILFGGFEWSKRYLPQNRQHTAVH